MNPFNQYKINGKINLSYYDFEILKDLEWHCSKCELKSGQAKTWQIWRDEYGIQFEEPKERRWEKRIFCENCEKSTSHRRLKTLDFLENVSIRSGIKPKVSKKVKEIYRNEEAFLLRKVTPNQLEVDHKFPQIRWNTNEDDNDNLSDEELKNKFILLSRSNNLLKSRQCEKCFDTGKRGIFPGIYFWGEGNEDWNKNIDKHDEKGCIGCFWHDPYKWRVELNKKIINS